MFLCIPNFKFQIEIIPHPEEGFSRPYENIGNYSIAGYNMRLVRSKASYVLQIYMPSAMFTIISWISFVIPSENGERAGLLVTLLLVIVSMYLAVVNNSPRGIEIHGLEFMYMMLNETFFVFNV